MPNDDKLRLLAEFAELEVLEFFKDKLRNPGKYRDYYFKKVSLAFVCNVEDWHPDTDPAHTMMVLEALVKASAKKLGVSMKNAGGGVLLDLSNAVFSSTGKEFDPGSAVCNAALEVME